jgi:hypothetical protein
MTLLTMTRGDTRVFTVSLTDADGVALDLTGLTITFTAKRRYSDLDDDAVLQKTSGAGIEVLDAEAGTATITIDPEDTADLELETLPTLAWDLQVENGGDVRTPLQGQLAIRPDVTHGPGGS